MNNATLITFLVYLGILLAMGFIASRYTHNLADYILGGRRLGAPVAALSAGASDMSGWLLLGLPGALYAGGLSQGWIAVGLALGAYLNWRLVAAPLRRETERANNSLTLPDFLENRFADRSRAPRLVSAVVILLFFTFYTSAGLVSGALLFESSFGLSYQTALWLGAAVIVTYTFFGGFLAVSWTDVFQSLLMLVALLVVGLLTLQQTGGEGLKQLDPGHLDPFHDLGPLGLASLLAWGLGYFGQPHILARFMAIKSPEQVPGARRIGMSWMILSLLGAMLAGLAGAGYFAEVPLDDPEKVFLVLTQVLFNPWVAGFLLAAILSAIMSTVDSQLLVASSVITEDFHRALLRPGAGDRELLWVGRGSVMIIALIAVLIASDPQSSVLDLVAYAWAGFGGAFGPVILFSLFWSRTTRGGVLAGMITGAATVMIWPRLTESGLITFELYEIIPAFLFNSLVIFLSGLARRNET